MMAILESLLSCFARALLPWLGKERQVDCEPKSSLGEPEDELETMNLAQGA